MFNDQHSMFHFHVMIRIGIAQKCESSTGRFEGNRRW